MQQKIAKVEAAANQLGSLLVTAFHLLALFVIGGAIVWSAASAFLDMMTKRSASVEDILLLFIYLELGAMVGIYFLTKRMPVRFLIYIAITALTRMLIALINVDHKPSLGILYISVAILLLAISVFIIKYGSYKYSAGASVENELVDAEQSNNPPSAKK